jgi:hypothetical protein
MNITFVCRSCAQAARAELAASASDFRCPHCDQLYPVADESVSQQRLTRCLLCGCEELYARSNFPQRLGLAIVLLGFLASSWTWFYHLWFATVGILFATALLDVTLYLTLGSLLQCYRCHAEYRGLEDLAAHQPFSLETHERYRQQAARLAEPGAASNPG